MNNNLMKKDVIDTDYEYLIAQKFINLATIALEESEAFNRVLNLITDRKKKDVFLESAQHNWKIADNNLKKVKNKWFVAVSHYYYLIIIFRKQSLRCVINSDKTILNKFYNKENAKIIKTIISNLIIKNIGKQYNSFDYQRYENNAYYWKQAYIAYEIATKSYLLTLKHKGIN